MIIKPRNLLWFIPVCLFVTSPAWQPAVSSFLTARGDYKKKQTVAPVPTANHFVMDRVSITLSSQGTNEWLIKADRASTGDSDRDIIMEKVRARYIGAERPPTLVDSQKGHYFINDRHLVLAEDVVISRPMAGEFMYTELLHYYDADKMAVSPGQVELKGPNFSLEAGRMDYDLTTDGYDFSGGVQVHLSP
ncbi:MAG: LPS export ABC transporter periplasmic protein LptC [Desulfobulbus propionicus]|nr:MAG: LPS export ABC transporter periplasmic protein LptC [Desulfobulbus propionicus]